ncbi:MAG TPA: COX15/CtaA family protein [Mycobacteriales bacterium]|jgi:heme A synthase|nr:COX15/CtaA family protein [Mycobacteriales bacterium]
MSRFGRLAVTTVAATLVLVAAGGFVRAMEAGLGCPDWPTCHGALNPPSTLGYGALKLAWIEHSHRLWAALLIGLIGVQAVAVRRTALPRRVRVACYWLVPAVLSQAVIGAFVVWLKLDAQSVLLHLAGAMTILGLAVYVALHALGRGREARGDAAAVRVLAPAALVVTLAQMILGSAVTGYGAGLAYGTFPSFNGRVLPPALANEQQVLHVAHRLTAYLVAVLVVWLAVRARRAEPLVRRTAWLAVALVGVQVALGALNVWFRLKAWSVAPHLAVGSWIVTALFVVAYRARWSAPAAAPEPVAVLDEAVPA